MICTVRHAVIMKISLKRREEYFNAEVVNPWLGHCQIVDEHNSNNVYINNLGKKRLEMKPRITLRYDIFVHTEILLLLKSFDIYVNNFG